MSKWVVTTRGASGQRESLILEAPDRTAVFEELKKRGISAIKVDEANGKNAASRTSSARPKWVKGLAAGLIVVICGVAALVCLMQKPDAPAAPDAPAKKPAKTALEPLKPREVKPPSPKPVEEPAAKPKELPPQKVGETRDGYIKLPSGRLHRVRGVVTNTTAAVKGKYAIFNHHCENEIACLLTIQPGEGLVGTPRYNGRFTKDFLESLDEPIVITAEDSPEDAELKRNMIETKKELKAAYDRGEDIEQIMLDTRKEYQKLSIFKMDMRQAINEYRKSEGVTDEDVEVYVQAANKMLEEKGIAPLNIGPITRLKIRMMKLQEREANFN